MILVTIEYRKQITKVRCNTATAKTSREVACYFYAEEKVEYYKGRIVRVEPA